MAYYEEIRKYLKGNTKEYFELIIRDTFFVIEGFFEIKELKESFIYLVGKKDILLIHGENFKLCCKRKLELLFVGNIYKLERQAKC